MLAVYMLSPFTSTQVAIFLGAFLVVLALSVMPKRPRIVALVALVLMTAYHTAYAIPWKPCDPLWKWMGWC